MQVAIGFVNSIGSQVAPQLEYEKKPRKKGEVQAEGGEVSTVTSITILDIILKISVW